MPGYALPEIIGAAVSTLKAAAEAINEKGTADVSQNAPSKREVVDAAERLKADAAKGA